MRCRTYVVKWSDGLLKVGFTSGSRYRRFVNRGADLVSLREFDTPVEALAEEQRLDLEFRDLGYTPAFTCREESFSYLGPSGCGWREVLRLASSDAPSRTPQSDPSTDSHERTDERTNGEITHHSEQMTHP